MFYTSDFKHLNIRQDHRNSDKAKAGRRRWCSLQQFSETLDEYCEQSSLHGLKYLRDPGLAPADRIFWSVIVFSSLLISARVIWELYWIGTNQFELTFNPISTPIWNIPFPNILICPAYAVRKTFFDLDQHINETKFRHFSKLVCPAKEEFGAESFNSTVDDEIFSFIAKAAIPCDDLIRKCIWSGKEVNCCSIFKPIITGNGLCYVFNSLPGQLLYSDYTPPPGSEDFYEERERAQYWDIDTGYPSRSGKRLARVLPYWSEHSGAIGGLNVELTNHHSEWQQRCSGGKTGYELKIYSPLETPETVTGVKIANNVHTNFVITPTLIHSEIDLLSLPKETRGCVFQEEFHLDYFRVYSQSACYIECFLKALLDQCGCVPISAHRILAIWNYSYCNDVMYSCIAKVLEDLVQMDMKEDNFRDNCLCMPSCTSLQYDFQSSSQEIVSVGSVPPWAAGYNASSQSNIARITIYFGLQQFNSLIRHSTSSVSDFLGSCGGLLGLLIGFSFISAYEVIYFWFIRPLNKIITYYIKTQFK